MNRLFLDRCSAARMCCGILVIMFGLNAQAVAQKETQKKYEEATEVLRQALVDTRTYGLKFYHRPAAEQDQWRAKWQAAGDKGIEAAAVMRESALALVMNLVEPDSDVMEVAKLSFDQYYAASEFERAYEIIDRLVELNPDNMTWMLDWVRASIMTDRFEQAKRQLDSNPELAANVPEEELDLVKNLDVMKTYFDVELALRKQEAEADDLPRVELITNKGKIVIELFENEAPETVGNFIHLVESDFYKSVLFHRVKDKFMAQAGGWVKLAESRYTPQPLNYQIYDEMDNDNARRHFRGAVSMAKLNEPNTGGAQFFITYVTTPQLDGRHTVFGRVIEGMKVVDRITRTVTFNDEGKDEPIEEAIPDLILEAKVIRKRDHEYEPNRVKYESTQSTDDNDEK